MKKKLISIALVIIMTMSMFCVTALAVSVSPTASTVYVNGVSKAFEAYNIGGNNFFKLRDLMEVLDVYVGYDNATKAITLDTSNGYEPEGAITTPSGNQKMVGTWEGTLKNGNKVFLDLKDNNTAILRSNVDGDGELTVGWALEGESKVIIKSGSDVRVFTLDGNKMIGVDDDGNELIFIKAK